MIVDIRWDTLNRNATVSYSHPQYYVIPVRARTHTHTHTHKSIASPPQGSNG